MHWQRIGGDPSPVGLLSGLVISQSWSKWSYDRGICMLCYSTLPWDVMFVSSVWFVTCIVSKESSKCSGFSFCILVTSSCGGITRLRDWWWPWCITTPFKTKLVHHHYN